MSSPSYPGLVGLGRQRPPDPDEHVPVVDTPAERVHHPADLVGAVLTALAIGLVVVLGIYAQGTTTGVTEDVQGFASVVRRILFVPVALLEGVITVLVPLAVLTELVLRRLVRHAFEAVGAAVVAILAALVTTWLMTRFAIPELQSSFSVWSRGERVVTIPALLTGIAALLTVAGSRNRRRTVGMSWNLTWVALGIALITGLVTLPAALLTVLIGRLVGLTARYLSGVQSERAYGPALVEGIRRAGFEPASLVRVNDVVTHEPDGTGPGLAAIAITRIGDNRVYAMTTEDGERLDVVVLDGDRQVVGTLVRFWRSLRLRGLEGRAVVSLRQAAERTALLSFAAWSAGVRTPRLVGLAESEDSMLLIQQHAQGAVPLRDLPPEVLTDDVLDSAWEQLRIAHRAGLAHRALTSDVVLVDLEAPYVAAQADHATAAPAAALTDDVSSGPVVLLTGWESGDVASSELARRMDIGQLLAALALRVGADRAVSSAARVFTDEELAAIGPLLQTIAMPRTTREEARERKGVLGEVRDALIAMLPDAADVEPEQLIRFGARRVITIALGITAAIVIVTSINLNVIRDALADAQPWWVVAAFGLGMVTFFGSALSLVAFAPIRLPLWRATLVQVAGSFVALAAPAGVGPAALNLRMLTRRGVSNTLAVASVGLVQVSQLVTTLLLLLVLSLVGGKPLELPSRTVLVAVALVALAMTAAMLVPTVRTWVTARTVPLWRQTWPRLVQLLSQPGRFAIAIIGNLIMTLGYLGAFYACLAAVGQSLPAIDLALIYLLGNTAGAVVPVPGGLGAVESALTLALINGGISAGIAAPVVIIFRALTFWARVPFGWMAMRVLQRTGEL